MRLLKLLGDYHQAFGLDEGEHEEIDLVKIEINTGEAALKKQ